MGQELLGDDAWAELFPLSGPLDENSGITMTVSTKPFDVFLQAVDQLWT